MTIFVRDILPGDHLDWSQLWRGYLEFYHQNLPQETTDILWSRFFQPAEPVHCMVAGRRGELLGLVHYIFHRNTWSTADVCYLEDLFVAPAARGAGIGRTLIEAVYAKARQAGAGRVYWMTHETNSEAQALYKKLAEKSGFIQYLKFI